MRPGGLHAALPHPAAAVAASHTWLQSAVASQPHRQGSEGSPARVGNRHCTALHVSLMTDSAAACDLMAGAFAYVRALLLLLKPKLLCAERP